MMDGWGLKHASLFDGFGNYLVGEGIIVRNRNSISLCGNCLRVTVGTRMENDKLIEALKSYE